MKQAAQQRFRIGSPSTTPLPGESDLAASLSRSKTALAKRTEAKQIRTTPTLNKAPYKPKAARPPVEKFEVDTVTLSYNEEHKGVELRFPSPKVQKIENYDAVSQFLNESKWGFAKMRNRHTVYDPRWYKKLDAEGAAVREGIAILEMVGGVCELPDELMPVQVNENTTTAAQ